MLRLIREAVPAPAYRLLFGTAHELRKVWWRLARPRIEGTRVVALDEAGRVLLVRHSYGSAAWMLPGGGLGRGEDIVAAATRELVEETGVALSCGRHVDTYEVRLHGARNTVHIVTGTAAGLPTPDGREVTEARYFATGDLPGPMPAIMRDNLAAWIARAGA
ncbi:hypothetical protein GCM10011371_19310 [Novosphingobium marinum]|uniref:8-oxo-dGTP pyrophosphatase MutT (NUDIX family) n=1 Tax=Novosphingobium marinum TaxID=1514948 RepID=A0A7Y9XWT8_9SPHN|nr:NUDIX domain-containing protein [Novosphingobium marinum]NYH96044.1 8-oxo-dGTP pyrophosphatase MutT (NUDIX family) [Novosphingobium marinum]GGC31992.1 hypothetical protein GCM10011371_19310 [Novosphingobium marinum]